VNVLLLRARSDHDHAIRVHQCVHDHAHAVNRYDHVRVYVHECVRDHAYECAHESESCHRECVRVHVYVHVHVNADACVHAFLSFQFSFLKSISWDYFCATIEHNNALTDRYLVCLSGLTQNYTDKSALVLL
jgi:hypothetical protein